MTISLEDFDQVDMRIGTVIAVTLNKRARKPAYKVTIDLGEELGTKTSSAQITDIYQPEELVGRQVVVVTNFSPIRIGDVKSEVRMLGVDSEKGVVLLDVERPVQNGVKIY